MYVCLLVEIYILFSNTRLAYLGNELYSISWCSCFHDVHHLDYLLRPFATHVLFMLAISGLAEPHSYSSRLIPLGSETISPNSLQNWFRVIGPMHQHVPQGQKKILSYISLWL